MTLYRTNDPRLIVQLDDRTDEIVAVGLSNRPPKKWPLMHLAATDSGNGYVQYLQRKTVAWVTPDVVMHVMLNLMEDTRCNMDAAERFGRVFGGLTVKAKQALREAFPATLAWALSRD